MVVHPKAGSKLAQGFQWLYDGSKQVHVLGSYHHLGVWLHSTKGLSVARDALNVAGHN